MKIKIIAIVVAVLTGQFVLTAQKMNPQEMADYQTSTMVEKLGLNEEQEGRIAEINLKYSKKQSELMAQEGSMFSKMGDMKKIGRSKNEELKSILSKEQMEKYEDDVEPQIRKYMRKKMMG